MIVQKWFGTLHRWNDRVICELVQVKETAQQYRLLEENSETVRSAARYYVILPKPSSVLFDTREEALRSIRDRLAGMIDIKAKRLRALETSLAEVKHELGET